MTPRKYLMISALAKQMEDVKEKAKKEADKFDIEHPYMIMCNKSYKRVQTNYYGSKREFFGYHPTYRIPEDIAKEVLSFYKELQKMKADEIYASVLNKLLDEAKDMDK